MKSYYIVRGDTAREEGLYHGELFVLDGKEEDYDEGIWLIPNDGGYAQWFGDINELMNSNLVDNHPL